MMMLGMVLKWGRRRWKEAGENLQKWLCGRKQLDTAEADFQKAAASPSSQLSAK